MSSPIHLIMAAMQGDIGAVCRAKAQGAANPEFDIALITAAEYGHEDCMRVAKIMGATDFSNALIAAEANNEFACAHILRSWTEQVPTRVPGGS